MKELTEKEMLLLKEVNTFVSAHNLSVFNEENTGGWIVVKSGEKRKRFTVWYHGFFLNSQGKRCMSIYDKYHLGYCNYENMLDYLKLILRKKQYKISKVKMEIVTLDVKDVQNLPEQGIEVKFNEHIVPFGKYKGMTIGDIKSVDDWYFKWIADCSVDAFVGDGSKLNNLAPSVVGFFNKMAEVLDFDASKQRENYEQ
jgi:hypothetical protein